MKTRSAVTLLTLVATAVSLPGSARAESTPAASASPGAAAAVEPTTTASGLQYVDVKIGTGPSPKAGQTVAVTYAISIGDRRIETSRLGSPFRFALGKGQALKGLDEGVATMKAGGQRKLIVPPSLGYGAEGTERVPPNATLVIEVELVEIH